MQPGYPAAALSAFYLIHDRIGGGTALYMLLVQTVFKYSGAPLIFLKIDSAGFIKFHALLFEEGLLHILAAERERGGSLAQAVYYPVARNNARLRVDMQSIADDARPARIAGESRYLPVSRNAAARDFSYNIVYQFECGFHLNHPKLF